MKAKLYFFLFCVFVVENLFATSFKVEYRRSVDGKWWDITATSLVDNIVVSDVRVNRGNCKNDFNLRQKIIAKPTKEQENQGKINSIPIGGKWREPKDLDYAEKYKKEILEFKIQKHKDSWQDKDGICHPAKDWSYRLRGLTETSEWSTSGTPEVQLSQEDIKKMEVAYQKYFCPPIAELYEEYYKVIREKGMQEAMDYPLYKHEKDLVTEFTKEENLAKILPKNILGFSMKEKCPMCNVDTCSDDDPMNFYSNREKNRYCNYQFDIDDLQELRNQTYLFKLSSLSYHDFMNISGDIDRAINHLSRPNEHKQREVTELKQLGVKFKRSEVPDESFSSHYPTLPPFMMIVDEVVEKPKPKPQPSTKESVPKATLKFGQSAVFSVPLSCRILEVQLMTNKGTETYNFK